MLFLRFQFGPGTSISAGGRHQFRTCLLVPRRLRANPAEKSYRRSAVVWVETRDTFSLVPAAKLTFWTAPPKFTLAIPFSASYKEKTPFLSVVSWNTLPFASLTVTG
jgi:hypothetical protein